MHPVIREAVVEAGPGDVEHRVAGVPLVLRTILSLQKAGIERCTLVGATAVPDDRRIRCAVSLAPRVEPTADDALRLLVGAGTVIDATLVRDLQGRARADQVLDVGEGAARVRVAPGRRLTDDTDRVDPPAAGTLVATTAPPGQVEGRLLRALENPRDGYLDRVVYRHLSRPLTRILLRTGVTPNMVTVVGIACGVLGGLLLGSAGSAGALAGVALLIASGVLDCTDGELARLRFAESRLGHALDVTGDTVVHVSVLGGIARGGGFPGWPVLVTLLTGVLGAFAVITWSDQTEERRRRVDAWENRLLDNVLSPLTTRDWYVFPVLFALAGRLDALVPAAAVGAHGFWVVTLVVLLRVLRRC